MPKLDGYAATQQIRAAESRRPARADHHAHLRGGRRASGSRACAPAPTTTSSSRSTRWSSWRGSRPCWREAGASATTQAARQPTLGRLAVFYGAKGGVGTTTIAINTAIALARELRAAHGADRRQPAVRRPARLPGPGPRHSFDRQRGQRARPRRRPAAQADRPPPLRHRPAARTALAGGGRHRDGAAADRPDHDHQPARPVAARCTTTRWSTWSRPSTTSTCSCSTRPTSSS